MKSQIVLAGVGGQGILFASKIFCELGLRLGLGVIGSETHGMSQRGGSVIAHIKLGGFLSPMIRDGCADILYSFEEYETYRNLRFLAKEAACFVNMDSPEKFDQSLGEHLRKKRIRLKIYDANSEALKLGSILVANIALIGYSVGTGLVPFSEKEMKEVIKSVSKKKHLPLNLKAFE
ncbi:MAG: indolepyruvate oxidoreductase subunit beta, partial [Candidatus Aminicenantales bacterium]